MSYEVKITEISSFINPDEVEKYYTQADDELNPLSVATKELNNSKKIVVEGDVGNRKGEVFNGNIVVGRRWDKPDEEKGSSLGGSKQWSTEVHLMDDGADVACVAASSEDFESRVDDSLERLEGIQDRLGLIAHSHYNPKMENMVLSGEKPRETGGGHDGSLAPFNPKKALGLGGPSIFRNRDRNKILPIPVSSPDKSQASGAPISVMKFQLKLSGYHKFRVLS